MVEYEIRTSSNPSLIAGSNPILLFFPTLTRLILNTLDTDIAFILIKCNFHLMSEGPPFPHANLVPEEAGPSNQTPHVIPFPYVDDEVISGESVHSIHHRLINALVASKREDLLLEDYRLTRYQTEYLFEVKVSIIRQMAPLYSKGHWEHRGAQALYNPRITKGEERSGIRGILLNRRNILIMSMSIESMLLAMNLNFLVFSISSDDMMGQLFALLVPTVAAAESAIGLAIFVITFRVRGTIAIESINSIQGFIIFSQKSLDNSFKATLDERIQAI
ncbi:hypothetical protein Cgig2_001262 [Carnegiea gigantea]|uniref:DUF8018 domain-containing protein n=1 Tax=Carnegiea gigantea TaxID=171969 RepID=A0A9Q1GWZ9_9CARY|nr:hypothetical protein Cgig2_001262 [Carnegiea gigantea]